MSAMQSPFILLPTKCPVCNMVTSHTNLRTGAYRASGKDSDFRPSGIVWANPEYQKYDPLLFFMATCSTCFYTREYADEFRNWEKDTPFVTYQLPKIAEKHMAAFRNPKGLVHFMGPRIAADKYPAESAVIKLVLGIYDELITEHPSALSLARFFLRLAWLFRGNTFTDGSFHTFANFQEFLSEAKSLFTEIPLSEQEALTKASHHYRQALEHGSQITDGLPQVQTLYLIAETSRRAGDFETADKYFAFAMKIGRELTHSSNADIATVNQTNRLLTTALDQARLSRERSAG